MTVAYEKSAVLATATPLDDWTAMYRVIRVLCEQPCGATLFVCENRNTGEEVVVKQATKHHQGLGLLQVLHDTVVVVNRSDGPPGVVASSMDQEWRVSCTIMARPHANVVRYLLPLPSSPGRSSLPQDSLVMEYCPGGDLFSLLEDHPKRCFDETEAMIYFRGIIDGVAHLHALDIAHRDLSLENVLLDAHGHAKICDFGLSTRASVPAHECVGKVEYMAPEVARATQSYDPIVADIWSLGIMLFIMLTGSPLFEFATPSDVAWGALQRVGIAGILRSWGMRNRVSDKTLALLSDMLRTDPAQRLQSLDDVRVHLN